MDITKKTQAIIIKTKILCQLTTIVSKYKRLNSILQRPLLPIYHRLDNPVCVAKDGKFGLSDINNLQTQLKNGPKASLLQMQMCTIITFIISMTPFYNILNRKIMF